MTPTDRLLPTSWLPCVPGFPFSTARWPAWAAAPTQKGPPATSRPKTFCTCCMAWASKPALTWTAWSIPDNGSHPNWGAAPTAVPAMPWRHAANESPGSPVADAGPAAHSRHGLARLGQGAGLVRPGYHRDQADSYGDQHGRPGHPAGHRRQRHHHVHGTDRCGPQHADVGDHHYH